MRIEGLPQRSMYATIEEWADALTAALSTGVDFVQNQTDGLPIVDSTGRKIVESGGITVYDSAGNTPIAQDIVQIDTSHLADEAVETAKVKPLAVTSALIADLAVSSAKIADLAVNSAKIANLAVSSGKIANLAVDTLQIAGEAITASKVLKNEILEINTDFGTDYAWTGQTADLLFSSDYIDVTATGGEIVILQYLEVVVTNYDDLTFADGPEVLVWTYHENLTDVTGPYNINGMNLAMQPRNLTGSYIEYYGTAAMMYTIYPGGTYPYDAGDSLRFQAKATIRLGGSATTYDLDLWDPQFLIIQAQP